MLLNRLADEANSSLVLVLDPLVPKVDHVSHHGVYSLNLLHLIFNIQNIYLKLFFTKIICYSYLKMTKKDIIFSNMHIFMMLRFFRKKFGSAILISWNLNDLCGEQIKKRKENMQWPWRWCKISQQTICSLNIESQLLKCSTETTRMCA